MIWYGVTHSKVYPPSGGHILFRSNNVFMAVEQSSARVSSLPFRLSVEPPASGLPRSVASCVCLKLSVVQVFGMSVFAVLPIDCLDSALFVSKFVQEFCNVLCFTPQPVHQVCPVHSPLPSPPHTSTLVSRLVL